jgi:hypothetical protein
MRKLMMAGALAVVLVPLFATAALAAGELIQCTSAPCYGGKGDDQILERIGNAKNDVIVPTGGDDLVLANRYTNDTDVVKGGGGFDRINVADGDTLDTANGGKGRDLCIVDSKKEAGTSCATIEVPNQSRDSRRVEGRRLERLEGPRFVIRPLTRTSYSRFQWT